MGVDKQPTPQTAASKRVKRRPGHWFNKSPCGINMRAKQRLLSVEEAAPLKLPGRELAPTGRLQSTCLQQHLVGIRVSYSRITDSSELSQLRDPNPKCAACGRDEEIMFTPTEVIACSTCDLHFCNVPCTRRSSCPHIEDTDVDAEAAYPELFAGHGCQCECCSHRCQPLCYYECEEATHDCCERWRTLFGTSSGESTFH